MLHAQAAQSLRRAGSLNDCTVSATPENALHRPAVNLIGGFNLSLDGRDRPLPIGMQRLIAFVALRGRPSRLLVAGVLWPEASDHRAQGNLRALLHRLHDCCPGVILRAVGMLRLNDSLTVDVREVTEWARRVMSGGTVSHGSQAPEGAYSGELLPGWYEDWVVLEQEHFRQLRLHALEALAEQLSRRHLFGEALDAAHCALISEPLRESAHRSVIRIHLAEGNLIEAARQYHSCRELLRTEMGIEPTPLLEALAVGLPGPRRRRP